MQSTEKETILIICIYEKKTPEFDPSSRRSALWYDISAPLIRLGDFCHTTTFTESYILAPEADAFQGTNQWLVD